MKKIIITTTTELTEKVQELEKRIINLERITAPVTYTITSSCPPHNYIWRAYEHPWGSSMPAPTMFCTKCGNWN
jgi:hypothetical protein